MRLSIVRHGRTTSNANGLLLGRADPDLDDVGRRQAVAVGDAVGPVDRIVSRPLRRCVATAAAVGERAGVGVEVDERLVELDYGEWDQTPVAAVPAETWAAWRADPEFCPPGGESLAALQRRVSGLLDELAADAGSGRHVALVTHVSPIKASVAWLLGTGVATTWRLFVAQASLTEGAVPAGREPSLRSFNRVDHLPPEVRP